MVEIYGYSIATLPIIATIVYGVIEFLKNFVFCDNNEFKKIIPILSAFIGGGIGVAVFFIAPETIPVAKWYSAIIVGCASGLSAVGINQITKQMKKNGGDKGGY